MAEINVTYVGFEYENAGIIAEIKRNIETLYATPEGTIPGDRSFGLNRDCVGMPGPVAQNQLALEVYEKTAIYEPRAEVKDISFAYDGSGSLKSYILIGANQQYEEDENE